MRLTRHNGRADKNDAYDPKYNYRSFDIENSDHIDAERVRQNVYWDCYNGIRTGLIESEDVEQMFYEIHYKKYGEGQNVRNLKNRHPEINRTADEIRTDKKTCPEETVYQIGMMEDHIDADVLLDIVTEFMAELHERFGEHVHLLDWALHLDESIGLTVDRIDVKNNVVHIDRQLVYRTSEGSYCYRFASTKSNSGKRDIPLTENAKKALMRQKELDLILGKRGKEQKVDGEKGLVFLTRNGTPMNNRNFGKALDGIVKAYNKAESAKAENREPELLPHISPHILRHTFCTRCAESGMDVKVLQTIMGHSNIAVTMEVYNHVDKVRVQNEMKKLENIM